MISADRSSEARSSDDARNRTRLLIVGAVVAGVFVILLTVALAFYWLMAVRYGFDPVNPVGR